VNGKFLDRVIGKYFLFLVSHWWRCEIYENLCEQTSAFNQFNQTLGFFKWLQKPVLVDISASFIPRLRFPSEYKKSSSHITHF
jgi:hypothetical protein